MEDECFLDIKSTLKGGHCYKMSLYLDEDDLNSLNELSEELDLPKSNIVRLMVRSAIIKYNKMYED